MNEQETITDIVKGIRAEVDYIEETARGSLKAGENYDGIAFTESDLESALDLAETKRKEADRLEAAHKREVDALKQRCAELNAEVAAKDEVIKRLNDAIAEEQRREMATAEKSSAVGNAAKLREALDDTVGLLEGILEAFKQGTGGVYTSDVSEAIDKARAALAAPPRNCDVGTPDEQARRFEDFCLEYIGCAEETGGRHCVGCPLEKASKKATQKCELYWAQMPYVETEGDSDGNE